MRKRKQKEKMPVWSEQELMERKLAMERLHPGYIDMEFRLGAWLGFVMIGRIFLHGLNIILGLQRGIFLVFIPFILLICFGFYSVCIRQQWKILYRTVPDLFYLNFWGDIWWVTTVGAVLLDICFLLAVALLPSVHRFVENDRLVRSPQAIEEAAEGV